MVALPPDVYDLTDPSKRHRRVLFRAKRPIQTRELIEIQRTAAEAVQRLADAVMTEGDVVESCAITVDAGTGAVAAESGKVYLKGLVADVPAGALTVPTAGTVSVGLRYVEDVVTEVEDETLRSPAIGTRNHGEAGAARLRWTVAWGWAAEDGSSDGGPGELVTVYTVVDGVVQESSTPRRVGALTTGEHLRASAANTLEIDTAALSGTLALRTRASAAVTLHCAPTGSDSTGDGSAENPFRQPQRAYDYAAANLDLAGQTLDISLADGSYDAVSLGPIPGHYVDNDVTGANSTLPTLLGNAGNPAGVVIDGSTNTAHGCGVLARAGAAWRVTSVTTKGATYGACAHEGVLHVDNCRHDAAPYALVAALAGGLVFITGGGRIVGGSEAAFLAHGGGEIYGGVNVQTIYVDNNPQFTKGFLTTCYGSRQILDALRWSGTARGRRHYTESGCTVYVGGIYAPGDTSGVTGTYSYVG